MSRLNAIFLTICAALLGPNLAAANEPMPNSFSVSFEPSVLEKCGISTAHGSIQITPLMLSSLESSVFEPLAACVLEGEALGRQLIVAPESTHADDRDLADAFAGHLLNFGLGEHHVEAMASNAVSPALPASTTTPTRGLALRIIDTRTAYSDGEVIIPIGERLVDFCSMETFSVFFEVGSVSLDWKARQTLDRVATCMRSGELDTDELLIVGNADPIGSPKANKRLALERARSVTVYLVGAGVPASAVSAMSLGERAAQGYLSAAAQRRVDIAAVN